MRSLFLLPVVALLLSACSSSDVAAPLLLKSKYAATCEELARVPEEVSVGPRLPRQFPSRRDRLIGRPLMNEQCDLSEDQPLPFPVAQSIPTAAPPGTPVWYGEVLEANPAAAVCPETFYITAEARHSSGKWFRFSRNLHIYNAAPASALYRTYPHA